MIFFLPGYHQPMCETSLLFWLLCCFCVCVFFKPLPSPTLAPSSCVFSVLIVMYILCWIVKCFGLMHRIGRYGLVRWAYYYQCNLSPAVASLCGLCRHPSIATEKSTAVYTLIRHRFDCPPPPTVPLSPTRLPSRTTLP